MSWSAHWITTIVLTTSTTYYRVTNFSERRQHASASPFPFFFPSLLLLLPSPPPFSLSLSRASLLEKFLQFPLRHGVMSKLHRSKTEANNNARKKKTSLFSLSNPEYNKLSFEKYVSIHIFFETGIHALLI